MLYIDSGSRAGLPPTPTPSRLSGPLAPGVSTSLKTIFHIGSRLYAEVEAGARGEVST